MFDIKKQLMWSKLRVGIIITFALLTLFMAVFFAGSIQDVFSPKVELKAHIHDVKGLRIGAPVWVSGIEVGSAKSINLDPVHGTIVVLSVNKSAVPYIKKDSQASVVTMGLLGDKYVELSTGTAESKRITAEDTIEGTSQFELKDIMETSTVSLQKMTDVIDKLDRLVGKIESGEGTIAKFLTDPSIYNNLREATRTLSSMVNEVKGSHGTLRMLIDDPSLYNKMLAASSSVEEFGKKLNNENGSLRKLVENAELYDNINKASLQLSSLLERVDKGEGVAGSLISDKELAQELKGTVTELKELTKDIKENPKKYFKFSIF